MAAELADTPGTANVLLPGGATATGMVAGDIPDELRGQLLDPALTGPPIAWVSSPQAEGVHDERILARDFDAWLRARERRELVARAPAVPGRLT